MVRLEHTKSNRVQHHQIPRLERSCVCVREIECVCVFVCVSACMCVCISRSSFPKHKNHHPCELANILDMEMRVRVYVQTPPQYNGHSMPFYTAFPLAVMTEHVSRYSQRRALLRYCRACHSFWPNVSSAGRICRRLYYAGRWRAVSMPGDG